MQKYSNLKKEKTIMKSITNFNLNSIARKAIKYRSLFISFLFVTSGLSSDVKIYSENLESIVSKEDIYKRFQNAEVLILGEEHNDKEGHEWKLEFIKNLPVKNNLSISMEMFERDQQLIINEYLQGLIDEGMFHENMRLWNNYISDYKPIVDLAKKEGIPVIAANAPRRYVRAISRNGLGAWNSFSPLAETYLPLLSKVQENRSKQYEEKFLSVMGMEPSHAQKMENFLLAQHIWDESMSECISREITINKKKVIHINGRFHSDEYLGVTHRLKQKGHKLVTVSIVPSGQVELNSDLLKLADFVVITNKNQK